VLAINADPVTIKQVELQIIHHAWAMGGHAAAEAHRANVDHHPGAAASLGEA